MYVGMIFGDRNVSGMSNLDEVLVEKNWCVRHLSYRLNQS